MKTLQELLRDADPLPSERARTSHERLTSRQVVLDAPRAVERPPQRREVVVVIAALMLTAIGAGFFEWSRTAVDVVAAVRFEARLAEDTPASGLRAVTVGSGRIIYLHQETIVTNSDIAQAHVVQGIGASTFGVSVTFNRYGAVRMSNATQGHIGKTIAILIDGQVAAAPTLRSPISASAVISGDFTKAEAERIAGGIVGR